MTGLHFGTLVPNLNFIYGGRIDNLYENIFTLVTILFILTQGALILFVFLFRKREGRKAHYSRGNAFAETLWTLIPLVILIGLYFSQEKLWELIKGPVPSAADSLTVQVFAEQFDWNFRYAGPDGKFGTADDIMTVNDLHVPVGKNIIVKESAKDVIHSFFVPYARIKQDAVPGMLSTAWFELDQIACWDLKEQKLVFFSPDEIKDKKVALDGFAFRADRVGITGKKKYYYEPFPNTPKAPMLYEGKISDRPVAEAEYVQHPIEIACAQLCGLGHYRMIGYITIDTPETYARWYQQAVKDKLQMGEEKWSMWDKYYPQFNQ